jgi:hypothetical protein
MPKRWEGGTEGGSYMFLLREMVKGERILRRELV